MCSTLSRHYQQRFEILDWYHLKEHLHNVGGSVRRLVKAENLLWQGAVDEAIVLFAGCKFKRAVNFLAYLRNHRHRIPEYGYLQQQGITIGSGAVESTIKQIGRRLKISGAQWNQHNVSQVLKHRVEGFNRIAHAMGLETIAEFVEDMAILEKLREIGVDYAQGYGISHPSPLKFDLLL